MSADKLLEFHHPVTVSLLQHACPDPHAGTPNGALLFGLALTKIRLQGIIVDRRQTKSNTKLLLDDGTGTIQIIVGKFVNKKDLAKIRLGAHFAIVGKYKSVNKMTATNMFELIPGSSQITWMSRTASVWQAQLYKQKQRH
jgi:aspartyl/asparaginyl-tRNA synthetase